MRNVRQSVNLPHPTKPVSQKNLQWNLKDYYASGRESWPAHLPVHQVSKDDQMEGTDPQEMEECEC